MDKEKAIAVLDEFIGVIDQYDLLLTPGMPDSVQRRQVGDIIRARLPLIERIAAEAEPDVAHDFRSNASFHTWSAARQVCIRIRGVLRDLDEREQILGPSGPQLAAAGLHPWVWESAASLWDDGHRRSALQSASARIEIQLQAKVGPTSRSGVPLVRSAFSSDPPRPGDPRLRFAEFTPGTPSWTDAHEGAMSFGAGCFQRIRNLASHSVDEPAEQVALEELAALSVLSRWIDDAQLEVAP